MNAERALKNVLSRMVGFSTRHRRSLLSVTASPETINDTEFRLDQIDINRTKFRELMKDKRKAELYDLDKGLYLYEYPSEFALLDTNNQNILYYMQYQRSRILKISAITQIKVWASTSRPDVTESFKGTTLTGYIFFEHLLPKADLIVTDRMQTQAGRRFWEKRIASAFSKGLNVYGIEQNNKALKKFNSYEEVIKDYKSFFYGDDHKYQARKLGISPNDYPDIKPEVFKPER